MRIVEYCNWGLIDYQQAWDRQTDLQSKLINFKRGKSDNVDSSVAGHLILCSHLPVYTLGKSGKMDHLKLNETELEERGISFYKINRGGDITYHGPEQIVGYPVFDLDQFWTDLHRYIRSLEEVIIRMLADYGIQAERIKEYTGVWLDVGSQNQRKICAIGVHMSRWVSMHGFALNVNTDLTYFDNIIPCGIDESDKSVTSMAAELGYKLDKEDVKASILRHFKDIFELEYK